MNRSLFKHGGVTQGDVTDSYLFQSKLRFRPQNKPEIWLDSLTRGEVRMSELSGVIWSCRTLPRLWLRELYIRKGGKGGTARDGVVGVSAKVQVHYLLCLTWPASENIAIIKKKAAGLFFYYWPLSLVTVTPHNKAVRNHVQNMLLSDVPFCIIAHYDVKMWWKLFSYFEKSITCQRNKLPHTYPLVIYLTKYLCVLGGGALRCQKNSISIQIIIPLVVYHLIFLLSLILATLASFLPAFTFDHTAPGDQRKTRQLSTMHLHDSALVSRVAKRPYRLTVNPKPAYETLHSNQAVISSQGGRPCCVYIALSGVYIWGSSFREQWPLLSFTLPVAK